MSKNLRFEYHKEMKCYVARLLPLGLTTYGETQEEANEKLVRMFEVKVKMAFAQEATND